MSLLNLYKNAVYVKYKHSICSFAGIFVGISTIFAIVTPFYVAFYLYHDLWSQYKTIAELPDIQFQHNYLLLSEHSVPAAADSPSETKLMGSSTYKFLRDLMSDQPECSIVKVSQGESNAGGIGSN